VAPNIADADIAFEFPAAPPFTYLRWIALWRDVEGRMREFPPLEALAARSGAAFTTGPVPEFLSARIISEIRRQATEALHELERFVAPSVRGSPAILGDALAHLTHQVRWLQQDGVVAAMGIEPPGEDVTSFMEQVVTTVGLASPRLWSR
jgi:hypothetical protein